MSSLVLFWGWACASALALWRVGLGAVVLVPLSAPVVVLFPPVSLCFCVFVLSDVHKPLLVPLVVSVVHGLSVCLPGLLLGLFNPRAHCVGLMFVTRVLAPGLFLGIAVSLAGISSDKLYGLGLVPIVNSKIA